MKANVGIYDEGVKILLAIAIAALYFFKMIERDCSAGSSGYRWHTCVDKLIWLLPIVQIISYQYC